MADYMRGFVHMFVDVIGQAIDIGEMQVVPVNHQIACCLWGRFAEHLLYAYKVGQVNQNFLGLLRFAKINVYKGQVQITNSFETSTLEINPPGFDVQDYQRLMPNDELALTTSTGEVVKPKGNKRQQDKWFVYLDRTVLDIIMATELHPLIKDDTGETKVILLDTIVEPIVGVSAEVLLDSSLEEVEDPEDIPDSINELIGKIFKFGVYVSKDNVDYGSHIFSIGKTWSADEIISESDEENTEDTLTNVVSYNRSSGKVSYITIESEDNTCLSSTPLSKRKGDNEVDDLSSTSKKQCSKIIKVEKNVEE
ncbi:uncharacterized protein LOC125607259 [Brassica napus]|uniref:uncharacterized protein LOC125607259 n=1 Tax=Brassica napus TaxID=3708 RepID=UPI0020790970|nr:uncharacterized protein LOC125607259 [Brassica napus]